MYQNFACAECGATLPLAILECPACGFTPQAFDRSDATPSCFLRESDVRLLEEAAAIHGGSTSPIGRAVAEKIRNSFLELTDAIPDGYVTLNSRVVFRVNGGEPLARVLVHWDRFFVPGLDLSLATPWGITLLGMRVGSEAVAYWRDGSAERIAVEAIPYRPASSRRATEAPSRKASSDGTSPVVRLERRRARPMSTPGRPRVFDNNDPGPSAA